MSDGQGSSRSKAWDTASPSLTAVATSAAGRCRRSVLEDAERARPRPRPLELANEGCHPRVGPTLRRGKCRSGQDHSLGRLWAVTARPHAGNLGQRSSTDDLQFHVSAGQRPNTDRRGPRRAQAADESACKPGSVDAWRGPAPIQPIMALTCGFSVGRRWQDTVVNERLADFLRTRCGLTERLGHGDRRQLARGRSQSAARWST
jgi:hypothetical protein